MKKAIFCLLFSVLMLMGNSETWACHHPVSVVVDHPYGNRDRETMLHLKIGKQIWFVGGDETYYFATDLRNNNTIVVIEPDPKTAFSCPFFPIYSGKDGYADGTKQETPYREKKYWFFGEEKEYELVKLYFIGVEMGSARQTEP